MPILDEHTLDLISHSVDQTRRYGVRLGLLFQPGDIVGLEGELGTGKTCLAQGVGEGMGVVEPITSPTFTLIAEHHPPAPARPLYHIDLYRLNDAVEEALALGLDEYLFGQGVCLIEWADRVEKYLPPEHLRVELTITGPTSRHFEVRGIGPRYEAIVSQLGDGV